MQAALDAAALILSKEAQKLTTAHLKPRRSPTLRRNLQSPGSYQYRRHPDLHHHRRAAISQLDLAGEGKIKTTFTGIWQPNHRPSAATRRSYGA